MHWDRVARLSRIILLLRATCPLHPLSISVSHHAPMKSYPVPTAAPVCLHLFPLLPCSISLISSRHSSRMFLLQTHQAHARIELFFARLLPPPAPTAVSRLGCLTMNPLGANLALQQLMMQQQPMAAGATPAIPGLVLQQQGLLPGAAPSMPAPAIPGVPQLPTPSGPQTVPANMSGIAMPSPEMAALMMARFTPKPADSPCTIWAGNLTAEMSQDQVSQFFGASCGNVENVRLASANEVAMCLPTHMRQTCLGQTFAFVQFEEQASAVSALALNNMDLSGRSIRVLPAKLPAGLISRVGGVGGDEKAMEKANEVQKRLMEKIAERKKKEEAEAEAAAAKAEAAAAKAAAKEARKEERRAAGLPSEDEDELKKGDEKSERRGRDRNGHDRRRSASPLRRRSPGRRRSRSRSPSRSRDRRRDSRRDDRRDDRRRDRSRERRSGYERRRSRSPHKSKRSPKRKRSRSRSREKDERRSDRDRAHRRESSAGKDKGGAKEKELGDDLRAELRKRLEKEREEASKQTDEQSKNDDEASKDTGASSRNDGEGGKMANADTEPAAEANVDDTVSDVRDAAAAGTKGDANGSSDGHSAPPSQAAGVAGVAGDVDLQSEFFVKS